MPYTGISRAILKGSIAGTVQIRNMFTGDVQLSGTDTDFLIWSEYLNQMFEDIKAHLSNTLTYTSIEIQHWIAPDWITMSDTPITWTGTSGTDALPNLVAAVLVAKAVGKRLIGRKFWSGVVEAATTLNSLSGGALTAFVQCAADYIAMYTTTGGSTLVPGILAKDNAFHTFSSGLVSSLLGSMRRRKPGLGI